MRKTPLVNSKLLRVSAHTGTYTLTTTHTHTHTPYIKKKTKNINKNNHVALVLPVQRTCKLQSALGQVPRGLCATVDNCGRPPGLEFHCPLSNGCRKGLSITPSLACEEARVVMGQASNQSRASSKSGDLTHLDFSRFSVHSASVCLRGAWGWGGIRTSA